MTDYAGDFPGVVPRALLLGDMNCPSPSDVPDWDNLPRNLQSRYRLVVLTRSVVHARDGWVAAECGVAAVVVVGVQKVCQGCGPCGVAGVGPLVGPFVEQSAGRVGRAARSLLNRAFSARPPSEPDGPDFRASGSPVTTA